MVRIPLAARSGVRARRVLFAGRVSALLLAVLVLSGCSSEDLPRLGMPTPVTKEGPRVLSLWQGSWIAAFAVGATVVGLILWAVVFHHRRQGDDELPPQVRYNVPIELLYTVLPFIVVAVLFYFTQRDESIELKLTSQPTHTVNVVGRQWSWTFNYIDESAYDIGTPAQPPTLWLPQGESVRFKLTSPDVIHSFWVPAFLFKMDVIPGRINQFEITPTRTGHFAGKCAELCGINHSRMLFSVRVVSPDDFRAHIADLKANGQSGLARTVRDRETTGGRQP